jgi:branched-chain amino acid transport system substrate-binding protein
LWYNIEFIRDTLHKKLGKELKDLKIAFLSEDSAYGQGSTEAARKRAQEMGIPILSVDYYNRNTTTDFTPIILKLKASAPDVVVATSYTNDAILFWKQAKQLDFNFKALVSAGAVGFGSPDFGKNLGSQADGAFALLEPAGINPEALSKEAREMEAEFAKRYEAKQKEKVGGAAQLGAAGIWILAKVLEKTGGDLNPDKFRAAVMSLDIPVGGMVNGWGVKFQENGQNMNERVQHYMLQWQDGKHVTVWPERFAVAPMKYVPLPRWSDRK